MNEKIDTLSKSVNDTKTQAEKAKHTTCNKKNGGTVLYRLEIAVRADTELLAINKLKDLGLSRVDQIKASDIDRQAELYILKVEADIDELVDKFYATVQSDSNTYILSDKSSIERSHTILKESSIVELQIRKLLLYILPETKKIFFDIINNIQKFKTSKNAPTTDIEWCSMISRFTFGELIEVLETDISEFARTNALSDRGLAELITSSNDFDDFKSKINEVSTPKPIWSLVNEIIEKPVEYRHVSQKIRELCELRNLASHMQIVTPQDIESAIKCRKHIMRHIGKTKSNYQTELQSNLRHIAKTMADSLNIAYKINPCVFDSYIKQIQNPLAEIVSRYKVDVGNIAGVAKLIKINPSVALSLGGVIISQMMANILRKELERITSQVASIGFNKYLDSGSKEMAKAIRLVNSHLANISDIAKATDIEKNRKVDNK